MASADYGYELNEKYIAFRNKFTETGTRQRQIEKEWEEAGCPIMDVTIDYYAGTDTTAKSKAEFSITKQDLMDFYPDQKKWAWEAIDTQALFEDLYEAENFLDNLAYAKEMEKPIRFEISQKGQEMLKMQDDLATQYKYKKQPELIGEINMKEYLEALPAEMADTVVPVPSQKPGYEVSGKDIPLYSKSGTKIAERYDRIVIGHYGAFLEIDPKDMCMENIKCEEGQEYRMKNPYFVDRIKYQWLTTKDDSHCKLYFQQKGVTYADYQPNKWYISPYEVLDEKERKQLEEMLANRKEYNDLIKDDTEIDDR